MKTVREVYAAYRIMPGLQLHQLRVGACGALIARSFNGAIDAPSVISACLLHDMGNIIKSDLARFPDFLEPQGKEYWQTVKDEYLRTYGTDEHHANVAICRDLGVSAGVVRYVDGVAFSNLEHVRDEDSYEQKIVSYCDARVGPRGVLPLHERQEEARIRYAGTHAVDTPKDETHRGQLIAAVGEIERQIFARCSIRPEDLNDAAVAPVIEELWEYQIA